MSTYRVVTLLLLSVVIIGLFQGVQAQKASFSVCGIEEVKSRNDSLSSGSHLVQYICAIAVHNLDDIYDTVLGNINITLEVDLTVVEIDDEEYAQVNGSRIQWVYPQNITIEERDFLWTEIETDYYYSNYIPMSINRWVNKSVFMNDGLQLATFNVTFEDLLGPNFSPSLFIEANEHTDVNASLLLDTFSTNAPIYKIEDSTEHRMKICLKSELVELNKTYNFSVVVKVDLNESSCPSVEYKPRFSATIGSWNHEYPETYTVTAIMPENLLPEHVHYASVSTNISNKWSYGGSFQQSMILKEIHKTFEEIRGFDTSSPENPYPSILGMHNGTITPNQTINVSKMYTYPCLGTGGHSEYVAFYNAITGEEIVNGIWNGYQGTVDYHYIEFEQSFMLEKDVTYNYTIRTGSYPQIHHTDNLSTPTGFITCSEFIDANGKRYTDWIPAIRLE